MIQENTILQGFRFSVTFFLMPMIKSPLNSKFKRVSGIGVNLSTEELDTSMSKVFQLSIPTGIKYNNITLERGLIKGDVLNANQGFSQLMSAFVLMPSNVLISLLDESSEPLNSWLLLGAYPVKWSLSDFDANNSDVIVETIELTYGTLMPMSL